MVVGVGGPSLLEDFVSSAAEAMLANGREGGGGVELYKSSSSSLFVPVAGAISPGVAAGVRFAYDRVIIGAAD